MLSYLIRRLLLFVPTIIGATFIVFMLMWWTPQAIIDDVLPPGGSQQPGVREARMAYLEDRYGLDQPAAVKYLRWLNNISPIGFQTWDWEDPKVVEQRRLRRAFREETKPRIEAEVRAELAGRIAELTKTREPQIDESMTEQGRLQTEQDVIVEAQAAREEAQNLVEDEVDRRMKALEGEKGFYPLPGDLRFDRVPIKAPDLGDSIKKSRPVWPLIAEALPVTLLLNALSLPPALAIALISGIWSAKHRGRWQDWGTGSVLLALYSVPVIWVGVMAIGFLANVQFVRLFPAAGMHDLHAESMSFFPGPQGRGYLLDTLWHLALPIFCLSYVQFAYLSKLTRTAVLETLGADYIRTARAKGLSPNTVLLRHGVRNSLIPVITFLAALLPTIITGSIVVEVIFSINGMGRLTIDALKGKDFELFLSLTLMILILKLICYLIADIAYMIADPRVSYAAK